MWLNLKFWNLNNFLKFFKKVWFFSKNLSNFKLSNNAVGMSDLSNLGLLTGNCPYFWILFKYRPHNYLAAHMWHTKDTPWEKFDFCACCVLIIMCLVYAHTWGCAPSWSSALGVSNAVYRSKIRQKLAPVAPHKVCPWWLELLQKNIFQHRSY